MKKLIFIVLALFMLIPFIISLVDLYWWFWFDHKLSSMDWSYNNGIKVAIAICMATTSMFPLTFLYDELKKELSEKR